MPTAPERYVAAQNGAVRLAVRDLEAVWARTDRMDALARRQALEQVWPLIVARYGEVTATLAADRFEDLTDLPAVLADAVDVERANARLRWGVAPLFGGAAADALARLVGVADELVKQPGRDTMQASAARHRLRYARVPTGSETCAFCRMLAARGFAYATEKSAGGLTKFHGACDCRVAIEEDARGYDPTVYQNAYQRARDAADSGKTEDVLAQMREDAGTH